MSSSSSRRLTRCQHTRGEADMVGEIIVADPSVDSQLSEDFSIEFV